MYRDYLARRAGVMLLIVFLSVSINFLLPRLMPGDPIEAQLNQLLSAGGEVGDVRAAVDAYRARFGLDRPLHEQYLAYWVSLLRLDLGFSLTKYPETVSHIILAALPWTTALLGTALVISFLIGTWLGGRLAWPGRPRWLATLGGVAILASSVPYFLLGMVLLYVFAVLLRWFPAGGGFPSTQAMGLDLATLRGLLWHAFLPAMTIIIAEFGAWAVGMRGMLVGVLGEDYVALARAKGLRRGRIFWRYGIRNALLPQFTKLALALGHIASGAILVEVIFSYPGLGYQLYTAIQTKDYFVIQGIVLLLSVMIAVAMFILDLIYPWIDPRITGEGER